MLPSLYNGARGFSHPALYRRGKKMSKTKPWGPLAAAAGTLAAVGLLLLIMLVVLYAQPAEANYPGTNGKIAYSGWDGNDLEIYTVNPDGGSNVKVTNNQSGNEAPAYSPNAKKIAYSGWDGNDWDIYTINTDGGSRKNVTNNNNTDDNQPSYSPSGKKIAYVYDAAGGTDAEIYYIKPDGGGRKNVTNNNTDNFYPYWGCKGGCK
jgi:dipeptidyl aminopeptidase/acylaminoacyl peptidase